MIIVRVAVLGVREGEGIPYCLYMIPIKVDVVGVLGNYVW